MSRKRLGIAALAASTFLGMASAQEAPIPVSAPVIEIDAGRSDHLLRDDADTAAFALDINGWDFGFSYATETPVFADERQRFAVSIGKEFENQRFNAAVRSRIGGETAENAVHGLWEHGKAGSRRFGVEGAFGTRDFAEYLLDKKTQGHVRAFYTTPKGIELSVFGSEQATPDLLSGSSFMLGLPRSSLQGQRTLADMAVGEDVVENAIGASASFKSDTKVWNAYMKKGEQFLRGTGEADPFIAYGGKFKNDGKLFFGNAELDVRTADGPVLSYNEARVLVDGGFHAQRFELGLGMYGLGQSVEFDTELMTAFYQTAGGALRAAFKFGNKTWVGLWGMIDDDAAAVHRVMRGGPFVRVGDYEFGAGIRQDRDGMARFLKETSGYFVSAKTPFGSGTVTVIDGETYGDLHLRLMRGTKQDEQQPTIPLETQEGQTSMLPDISRYAQSPLLGSRANVEWGVGAHSGTIFTRNSVLRDRELQSHLTSSETGGTYRFSSGKFMVDLAASIRDVPALNFHAPTGRVALLYQLKKNAIGVGWLQDHPDFAQGREATFAFLRTPLNEELRLESALGMQDGGAFASFMLSIPTSRPVGVGLLPQYLLPPTVRAQTQDAMTGGVVIPGPKNLVINFHNCYGCAGQQEVYLRRYRDAFSGMRLGPIAFSTCRAGDAITSSCTDIPPGSDAGLNLALELFGDQNLYVVDWDANSRPTAFIPADTLYTMVTNLLRYDPRVRLVQCAAEIKNTSNQDAPEYVHNYLEVCERAVDDVNRERPPGMEAFLLDAAPFGTNTGSKEMWRRYRQTDAFRHADGGTCHVYDDTVEGALRLLRECKAPLRNKPLAITESNVISQADNATNIGGSSSYSKHRWWLETVMPQLEQEAMRGVPEDQQWMVKSVFYTLTAHQEGEYNLIRFRNHFDPYSWEATSDAQQVIEERARLRSGLHSVVGTSSPASVVQDAAPYQIPGGQIIVSDRIGLPRKVEKD